MWGAACMWIGGCDVGEGVVWRGVYVQCGRRGCVEGCVCAVWEEGLCGGVCMCSVGGGVVGGLVVGGCVCVCMGMSCLSCSFLYT